VFSPPLQALARLGDRETLLKLLLHEMPLRLGGHTSAPAPRRATATTTSTGTADGGEDNDTPEETDEQQPSPRRKAPPTARRAPAKAKAVPPHAPSFVVAMGALREAQPALGAELFFMYVDATEGNTGGNTTGGSSSNGGHNGAKGGSGGGPLHPALVDAALQVRFSAHLLEHFWVRKRRLSDIY
jgi:hypothetical protein